MKPALFGAFAYIAAAGRQQTLCVITAQKIDCINYGFAGDFPKHAAKIIFAETYMPADVVYRQLFSIMLAYVRQCRPNHIKLSASVPSGGNRLFCNPVQAGKQRQRFRLDGGFIIGRLFRHFKIDPIKMAAHRFICHKALQGYAVNRHTKAIQKYFVNNQTVISANRGYGFNCMERSGVNNHQAAG